MHTQTALTFFFILRICTQKNTQLKFYTTYFFPYIFFRNKNNAQQFLQTFTDRRFVHKKISAQKICAQFFFNTDAFSHRWLYTDYTQKLVQTTRFYTASSCTEMLCFLSWSLTFRVPAPKLNRVSKNSTKIRSLNILSRDLSARRLFRNDAFWLKPNLSVKFSNITYTIYIRVTTMHKRKCSICFFCKGCTAWILERPLGSKQNTVQK